MEERINVAEILRNCQAGMNLDCVCFENVVFDRVDDKNRIRCFVGSQRDEVSFNEYGCLNGSPSAKCVIFPEGEITWDNLSLKFSYKDGDILYCEGMYCWVFIYKHTNNGYLSKYVAISGHKLYANPDSPISRTLNNFKELRFATQSEKQKLFDVIKGNGYRWNAETKTLEKLIIPKFNISSLKPFERVLVRDSDGSLWCASMFSHIWKDKYYCTGVWYNQCIPYELNEHLLGTTNDCDEFYKTWKNENSTPNTQSEVV